MSCIVDTIPLLAGSCVVSEYPGFGITGAALRTATASGGSGAGLLYNDWDAGDDAKEFMAQLVTAPSDGTLTLREDGSFSLTGAGDGSYSLVYRLFVDGADLGTAAAAITVGSAAFSVAATGLPSMLAMGTASFSFSGPSGFAVSAAGLPGTLSIGAASFSPQFGPSLEPVTVDEARVSARFDSNELDDDIAGIIVAARKEAEHLTGRVFRRRAFTFELDAWPAPDARFAVFEPDACAVSFFNEARSWVSLDASAFEFAAIGSGAEIAPALDTTWPTLGRRAVGARVRVTFTAGPASRDDVDERVKLYIKAVVAAWVNNPEAVQSKALVISPLFARLLDGLTVYG